MSTRIRIDALTTNAARGGGTGRPTKPGSKWRARVKVMGMEMFLGTYDTKEEADAVEDAYREWRRARQAGEPIHPSWSMAKKSALNGREYLK